MLSFEPASNPQAQRCIVCLTLFLRTIDIETDDYRSSVIYLFYGGSIMFKRYAQNKRIDIETIEGSHETSILGYGRQRVL